MCMHVCTCAQTRTFEKTAFLVPHAWETLWLVNGKVRHDSGESLGNLCESASGFLESTES